MLNVKPFYTFFDGDPVVVDPPVDDPAPDPEGGDPKKSFTQDEVNAMLARERKKVKEQTSKTVTELEQLKKAKGLTETEKATLQIKIDELQTSLMTKEELSKKEQDKIKNQHKKETDILSTDRDTWKDRFTTSQILQSITQAAAEHKAFSPNQIIALLKPMTSLKEVTTEDGTPTGVFQPRVKYPDTDKEGKEVTLDLTVPEAVKRMKETTDKYGNLFTETASGGLGMGAGTAPQGKPDFKTMNMEQYKQARVKQLGLNPFQTFERKPV